MAINFPTSLDDFTNPLSTDNLNAVTVPHAAQHANLNDAVEALEAKVGVDNSAVTTSIDYQLRNLLPVSTFAALPSAATAGANKRYLVSDWNAIFISNGTIWKPLGGSLLLTQTGVAASTSSTTEATIATVTIPAGLMTPQASLVVRGLWTFPGNVNNKYIRLRLGGTSGTPYMFITLAATNTSSMRSEHTIQNRNAANSQVGKLATDAAFFGTSNGAVVTSAVDTASATTLVFTGQTSTGADTITLESYSVELKVP